MKKAELIEALSLSRADFIEIIAGLSDEEMEQPGQVGNWSIKDVLAHLNMWEAESIKMLFQAGQGSKPTTLHFKQVDDDAVNAQWYAESKDRSLEAILDDFEGVRNQLIRRLETFKDSELNEVGYFPWLKNQSLSDLIISYTIEHETEHAANIRTWRQARSNN